MNLDELWIGDRVLIIRSQRIGTFEGINTNGKARIKLDKKVLLIKGENLELVKVKRANQALEELEVENNTTTEKSILEDKMDFIPELDLHMRKLQPSKAHDNPIAILEFQLRKLTEFMEKAISLRLAKVTVIHGKGTGALRMETMNIIDSYPEKVSIYPINNDGGMIVYLRYS